MRNKSEIILRDDFALVALTKGLFAQIDVADIPEIEGFAWYSMGQNGRFYAGRNGPRPDRVKIPMHREICNPAEGMFVDHIDGNCLNNRRSNLRACTSSENMCNQRTRSNNTSGFAGVSLCRKSGKWQARIMKEGRALHLGRHESKQAAIAAYRNAAIAHHGEFSGLGRRHSEGAGH